MLGGRVVIVAKLVIELVTGLMAAVPVPGMVDVLLLAVTGPIGKEGVIVIVDV